MFVHRKNVIKSYEQIDDSFQLSTIEGDFQGAKGDYVATNLDGDMLILEKEYVAAMKNIEIKPHSTPKVHEGFANEYIKQLKQMGILNQEESDEYIKGENYGWECYRKGNL